MQVNGSTVVGFDVKSLVRCIIGLKDLALVGRYEHLKYNINEIIIHPKVTLKSSLQSQLIYYQIWIGFFMYETNYNSSCFHVDLLERTFN